MGMSLQCGILNNNRIGEIDPYVIFYLNEKCGMKLPDIKKMLQTESGLYGLSGGISNDLRDIEVAAEQGNHRGRCRTGKPRCRDSIEIIRVYCEEIYRFIRCRPGWC